ncbi:6-phosphofructokinase [Halarcobacter anaerophilus]|uniref:6-phosphofructokinase n=1 Tax=Halarcobacter anaerophilus TaxID=877500 RepID=A0A4V1LPT0_9BACT|nr:6-phosphofructokinase [Halarcobacter anaerophilus]QDF30167.1 6-phosphofructokinase [Halarcobacter anaerophilus]RXJ62268.1 6-phosphofructokinase [Halarcobacter anaerophilus]
MAIAIMTSGGDCAGMNPAIKHFVDYCYTKEVQPYLIYDGLEGLIDGNIKAATYEDVAGIMHEGGTKIRSSRSKRFFEYEYRKQAFENLKKHKIDKILILGGDGSFRALNQFYKDFGVHFVGVPATIDNDIFGTSYCLGVDTALNIIRGATDAVRDTSSSFRRACVIETMGRDCGYLALVSAITCGAEVCIIPELEYDLESIGKRLKEEIKNGRKYVVCIVAEGCNKDKCTSTNQLVQWLENDIKIETRATILGHVQRGGNPTVFDRLMASKFVTYSIDKLLSDQEGGSVIVYNDSKFEFVTIDYVNSQKYEIREDLLELAKRLVN